MSAHTASGALKRSDLALQGLIPVCGKPHIYSTFASRSQTAQPLLPPSKLLKAHAARQFATESTSSKVHDARSQVQNMLGAPARTVKSSATTVYKQMPRPVRVCWLQLMLMLVNSICSYIQPLCRQ